MHIKSHISKMTFSFIAAVAFATYSAYCRGCIVSKWDFIPEVEPSGLLILCLQLGLILHRTTDLSSVSRNFSQRSTFLLAIFFLFDLDACASSSGSSGSFLFLPLLDLLCSPYQGLQQGQWHQHLAPQLVALAEA